jgi:hypothetical protein
MTTYDQANANGRPWDLVVQRVFQAASAVTLGLAGCTAVIVVALRILHCFQPTAISWGLKSGIPLILIGVSFTCLQFAFPRSLSERLLALSVGMAFVLWGTEQFVSNVALAAFMDDIVMFLFVLDLSIVIWGRLKPLAQAKLD